ncbi:hypothetical protein [Streptomyces sp. enrichment culture]|uniref:hypothetical protein n=1 Tax=Streptomyces sp. enrichment culture TaxID=1795815 RepID=UPI003F554DF0
MAGGGTARPGSGGRDGTAGAGRRAGPDGSRLSEELRLLGRSLERPGAADGPESMAERVLAQILAERLPVPVAGPPERAERLRAVRRWARDRRRSLAAVLCGLLTVLALTPPVRAAVLDWFDFGGVEVRYDPSATPSPEAQVPGCARPVSLAQAARQAGFQPLVPRALGAPDAVSVSREPQRRFLVTLCWKVDGRTVRLDEFPAQLDVGFAKAVPQPAEFVQVDGESAVWLPRAHLLDFWLEDDRGRFAREERTSGPTLLWGRGGGLTLRLEGVASRERAVEIAGSVGADQK